MTTLYPMDFHRRVDRRWAERMNAATADSMAHARLAGQRRNDGRALLPWLQPPAGAYLASDTNVSDGDAPPTVSLPHALTFEHD
jgi:hypothetical protein